MIVCGHYGCGAVKAALRLPSKTQGLVNCWISDIRDCRNQHRAELMALPNLEAQIDRWEHQLQRTNIRDGCSIVLRLVLAFGCAEHLVPRPFHCNAHLAQDRPLHTWLHIPPRVTNTGAPFLLLLPPPSPGCAS